MSKNVQKVFIEEFVRLQLKIHYPRVSSDTYSSDLDGTIERMKDEVRLEYLRDIIKLIPEWDTAEMSKEASKMIRKKTNLF